ncbi:MAG: CTP synthetase [Silicimonas sp.]|nr:CTP synthetase [Silicimonas sp.]
MLPLFLIVHIFVGSTFAGAGVIAALSVGLDTLTPLLVAALLGFLVSIPVSWFVAKRMMDVAK